MDEKQEITQIKVENDQVPQINVAEGDYIGRDASIFSNTPTLVLDGDFRNATINISNEIIKASQILQSRYRQERISAQIQRLRGRITKLGSVQKSVKYLSEISNPSTITTIIPITAKAKILGMPLDVSTSISVTSHK